MRVLLADDHALVRAGIRALLEQIPDVEVVGAVDDGLKALAAIPALRPDVLLADIAMPSLNGLDMTARVALEFPQVRVIILSMHDGEEYVMRALRAGAAGYLLKDSATIELRLALEAVRRGDTYLSPAISRAVVSGYLSDHPAPEPGVHIPHPILTPRQRQILTLVAEGRSTKEIAFALHLSAKTVESHRAQIMARLGIRDVAGLVKYAMRAGLIPPAG